MRNWLKLSSSLMLVLVFLMGCEAEDTAWMSTPISSDPDWQHGQLENGMKYHLYHKQDAPLEMRFIVHAGALQETSSQHGYAHFLEHMAFNDTRHLEQQDVWQLFSQLGISGGSHLNAFTSFDKTWYQLTLPNDDEVSTALTWFRDAADGILLKPEQIEKERGIILGELRASDPQERSVYRQIFEVLQAANPDYHQVLGTKDSIQSVTAKGLQAYYQRWYFPSNTDLVIVGDFDKANIESQISKQFASWQAVSQPLAAVESIQLPQEKQHGLVAPEGSDSALILLQPLGEDQRLTYSDLYHDFETTLINNLIRNRLIDRSIALSMNTSVIAAYDETFEKQKFNVLEVSFKEAYRSEVQAFVANELASLRDHGIGEAELAAAMASYHLDLNNHAENWHDDEAWMIMDAMVDSLSDKRVMMSEVDRKAVLTRFVANMDQKYVNKRLNQTLAQLSPYAFFAYSLAEQTQQLAQDVTLFNQQLAKSGQELMLTKTVSAFPTPDTKGEIVAKQQIDPKTWQWQLSNGVEVWLKQMPEIKQNVYMNWAVDAGRAQLDPSLYAASELAVDALYRSELAGLDAVAFEKVFAANNTLLTPYINDFDNGLSIATQYDNLPFALSALHQVLTAVKVDPKQLELVKKQYKEDQAQYASSPLGQVVQQIEDSTIVNGDFARMQSSSAFGKVTSEDVEQVYQRLYQQRHHNRLIIAGNIAPQEITTLLRQYIANIPLTESFKQPLPVVELNPESQALTLPVSNEASVGYIVVMTNPISTNLAMTATDVMANDMLQRIIDQRAFEILREKHSLTYSPFVMVDVPDSGLFSAVMITLNIDAADLDKSKAAVTELIQNIRQQEITQQERDSVAKQLASALKPMATNGAETVHFMGRYLMHGYDVNAVKDPQAFIDKVTPELLNQQIKQVMGEQSYTTKLTVLPKAF
ncbi:hypothetical protein A3K86_06535 [Photobacterium jeanii]|uniref:Peptidase M16 n=1 Tax=Photobacterium jeanii TaxID=858640 RepID=A0A178KMX3_9GAMM|nr:M16 family metallopeptidase [Photobacterium jeanii]OAN18540.1 hypothetical protein A3K86_06535 [Photobacterium jeanii]PST91778.1 insulinase family protein [Photobacterium jeanii]